MAQYFIELSAEFSIAATTDEEILASVRGYIDAREH
jgi:hypothetical protein